MLNIKNWEQIISDYKVAWNCLVCPKHCNEWHREENKGLFYLLKAYLAATEETEKGNFVPVFPIQCSQRAKVEARRRIV